MANNFTANPWTIDTPYSTAPSKGHIAQSMVRANYITWTNMAAGATLLVLDRNGNIIMNATQQATANIPIVLSNPGWVNGLFVPTLSSGVISVGVQKIITMPQPQQVKTLYTGPYTGVDVSMPATDIAPQATPFCQNVFLKNGEIRSRPELSFLMVGPGDGTPVQGITCFEDINAVAHTVCLTQIGIYQLSSNWQAMIKVGTNPWLSIANFSQGQPNIPYATAVLQTNLFFSNGGNGIFQWNGTTNTAPNIGLLANGTTFGAFYLMELNAKLVVGSTIETLAGVTNVFPFRIRWTSTAPSFSSGTPWDVTTNLGAGFSDLFDVPDIIMGIMPLGAIAYIYRNNGITQMIPNGAGNGFDFDHLWASDRGIGAINAQTLAGYGPMHMFLAADEIYQLTPNSFNQVGAGAIDAIKQDVNNASGFIQSTIIPYVNANYVYLSYWLVIPFSDSHSVIWIYDIKRTSWTRQLFNNKIFTTKPKNVYIL